MNKRTKKLLWLGCLFLLPWVALPGCGGGGGSALPGGGGATGGGTGGGETGGGGSAPTVTRTITGTVFDGAGNAVNGASVTIAGTRAVGRTESTLTGADGKFTLTITIATSVRTVVLEIAHPTLGTTQVDVDLSSGETVSTVAVLAHGGPPDPANTPPAFTAVSAAPTTVDFTGGQVTLSATVTDPDTTTLAVLALVSTGAGGQLSVITLTGAGSTYTGAFTAPANYGVGAQDKTYEVSFVATDAPSGSGKTVTADQTASFTVKGYSTPPNLP